MHFAIRVREQGRDPAAMVIVILEVDDPLGGAVANRLMPGHDWQPIRDRGQMPVACGLAMKAGIAVVVGRACGVEWAQKLDDVPAGSVAVCVIAGGAVCTAYVDVPTEAAPAGAS